VALDRQRRTIRLRLWAAHGLNERKSKQWRTRRAWDQARKLELANFVDQMTQRFSGVDEDLLRWLDRLKASEPPASKPPELQHVSETLRGIVARCEGNLPSDDDGGPAA
jgi:hypothetical protein